MKGGADGQNDIRLRRDVLGLPGLPWRSQRCCPSKAHGGRLEANLRAERGAPEHFLRRLSRPRRGCLSYQPVVQGAALLPVERLQELRPMSCDFMSGPRESPIGLGRSPGPRQHTVPPGLRDLCSALLRSSSSGCGAGRPTLNPNVLKEPESPHHEPRVRTPEEAEREVRNQFEAGYDIIKFREKRWASTSD
jgi:hypothetical protein